MRRLGLSLLAAATLLAAAPAFAQPTAPAAPPVRNDARELLPAALIGIWKVDFAASKYPGNPPKEHLRIFQYTEDAKLLVTFMTIGANGNQSAGHWAVNVDGSPGVEYHTNYGGIAYNVVNFTKVDDYNYNLLVSRKGVPDLKATYKLAQDGKTLTYVYGNANGSGTTTTVVYKRWEAN